MSPRFSRAAWVAIALSSFLYAPMALTAMWSVAHPGGFNLAGEFLSHTVSDDYAYGPRSGISTQTPAYERHLFVMVAHTVAGAGLMLLGPLQFWSRLRRNRPALHRRIGLGYLALVAVSTASSGWFLATTSTDEVFSGAPFEVSLTLVWLGTVFTAVLAYVAIARRDVVTHLRLLAVNYALLMSAPLLRYEWALLGNLADGKSHDVVNLGVVMHIAAPLLLGATLAQRSLDRRRDVRGLAPSRITPTVVGALSLTGLASVAGLLWAADNGDSLERFGAVNLLGPLAVCWVALAVAARRAHLRGDLLAAREWLAALAGTAAGPTLTLMIYLLLRTQLDDTQAFLCAGALGWPLCLFAANMSVTTSLALVWHRKRSRSHHHPEKIGSSR